MTPIHMTIRSRFNAVHPTLTIMAGITALIVVLGMLAGCTPKTPPPTGVSNPDLDLSIGFLGDEWTVQSNQGNQLMLVPSGDERQGTVEFLVGPEQEGVNLVEALKTHQDHIEGLSDGVYSGGQELTGPMGTAFYSRGRYNQGAVTLEETRILSLHPRSSRLVEMVYRYPAGEDSAARVGELIELFAEVE